MWLFTITCTPVTVSISAASVPTSDPSVIRRTEQFPGPARRLAPQSSHPRARRSGVATRDSRRRQERPGRMCSYGVRQCMNQRWLVERDGPGAISRPRSTSWISSVKRGAVSRYGHRTMRPTSTSELNSAGSTASALLREGGLRAWATEYEVPWIHFAKGRRKDDVVEPYRARFQKDSGVVLTGVAQERASAWRARTETSSTSSHVHLVYSRTPLRRALALSTRPSRP